MAIGSKESKLDEKVERDTLRQVERQLNNHTRMLIKVFNVGEQHNHVKRVTDSKLTTLETCAPKYYLYKDHKEKESWRPVVSGCNSNTLGLSNLLSDVVEPICTAVVNPYEVISSKDLLSRIEVLNKK